MTAIILTILMLIIIEKRHKRFLISFNFDFQALKDSITFINYIFRRGKFKRFKHYLFFL